MKRILSVVLACALLVGCVMIFASCGLSGKYEANIVGFAEVSYEFKGSKVIVEIDPFVGDDVVLNGSYKLGKDDNGNETITITFEDTSSEKAKEYGGTFSFAKGEENGEKYIKIGIVKYELED